MKNINFLILLFVVLFEFSDAKVMKYTYGALFIFIFCTFCKGQGKADIISIGPNNVTRTIKQDRNGNIWIAAFDGVFRYDGKSFTDVMSPVSSARFFSLLEDRKGNLWFGSIGSGVYSYDGNSFKNLTTKDGLVNNEIGIIYEDKTGNIWFGANGGVSRYDGKSFRNYLVNGDVMNEDKTGKTLPDGRPMNEINSIVEDKTGKLWFATRGNTFIYDGKTFSVFRNNEGKPFTNVRSIIEDRKGNIWLGGNDGLWRYDGKAFTNFTQKFVGYIYEDKKGNIWTSSGSVNGKKDWALSRYNQNAISGVHPIESVIITANEGMIFGILEANDGSIWFGTLSGVHRYDGTTINDFTEAGLR